MHGTLVPSALDPSLFIPDLKCRRKDSALAELVACAGRGGVLRHPELALELLAAREALGSTSPGRGIAVPAIRSLAVQHGRLVVARSRRGIEWGAPDELPVHVIALVCSPAECPASQHVETVLRVAAAMKPQRARAKLMEAETFEAIAALLREALP